MRPQVVIIGAGFGGLAAAHRLSRGPVDVTVVDRNNFHTFQPLLYQVATAGLQPGDVSYPVRGVFQREQNVRFRCGWVTAVDRQAKRVHFADGVDLTYDHLILAAGAAPNFFGIPGADENGFILYTLEDATLLRNRIIGCFEQASVFPERIDEGILNFAIVGAGPTGVEVAGALSELIDKVLSRDFKTFDVHRAQIYLVEMSDRVLGTFGKSSQDYAERMLRSKKHVNVLLDTAVDRIDPDRVHLASGEVLPCHTLIWCAGIRANELTDRLGLDQGSGGRIMTNADLSVPNAANVYVIGDCAEVRDEAGTPLPQVAQPAIQGGRHVADTILGLERGEPSKPFRYVDKGTMATIGRRAAVAELAVPRLALRGFAAWVSWLALHLVYLLGMRNRLQVLLNWAWNYLTWDRGPRIILQVHKHLHGDASEEQER